MTVITAADIERINAHTLTDILQTIPGVQLDYLRTPTTFTFFSFQGQMNQNILVLVDGVRKNDFQQRIASPGLIPVQMIERIEIVKGAASAAWGPAVGGVVNIITKRPDPERPVGGLVSASAGKRWTTDGRVEVTGTDGRLGYYVTGGNIRSDGLLPNNGTDTNHAHAKLSISGVAGGTLTGAFFLVNAQGGQDEGTVWGWPVHDDFYNRETSGYLKYSRPLADRLVLDLGGHLLGREQQSRWNDRIDGANVVYSWSQGLESDRGADARVTWGDARNNIVAGAEYGHSASRSRQFLPSFVPYYDRAWERWGAYANGTFSAGPVTILPGIRYDRTGVGDNPKSWTLGATWQLTGGTLLRGYGARGYGLPNAIDQGGLVKVSTVQAGFETTDVPALWLKGTYFFNRLRDLESAGFFTSTANQLRQGFELEGRTLPWHGVALTGGYTFTYVKDPDTGERVKTSGEWSVPPQLLKLGILYDRRDLGLRGTVTGSYVGWNAAEGYPAQGNGIVWDAHLNWKVKPQSELSPELFASWRNLFSNQQTVSSELFQNAKSWAEGGVRWRF
jgi:vitamin B12 transporter